MRRRPKRLDSTLNRLDGREGDIHIERLIVGMVQTNCYILENQKCKRAVVIDPGDKEEEIAQALEKKELELEAVLLTHGHFDHGLAAAGLAGRFQVPVYANQAERQLLADPHLTASFLLPGLSYTLEPGNWVQGGELLELAGVRLRALDTPGHTIGGTSYYLPDYQVVFSGDTLFCGSVGRTDLPTGDARRLFASIRDVLFELPPGTMVLPGHGGSTTIELERRYNPYLDESGFWE